MINRNKFKKFREKRSMKNKLKEEDIILLKNKKLFLLDMDGTIYLDERLFDGTCELLDYIRKIGGIYIFLTNNSSRGTESYIAKMQRLGIDAKPEDFVTSADAAVWYIHENFTPDVRFYLCGTRSLKEMLIRAGIQMSETPEESDALLLGYDTELTYQKLCDSVILINRGVPYLATHPDLVCPVSYGYAPDCGSVINMLETCTGKRPVVIGKPQPQMVYLAMEKTGYAPAETIVIGDRLYTDIACGVNAGIDSIFVLSGEGMSEDIQKYRIEPSYMLKNVRELVNHLNG